MTEKTNGCNGDVKLEREFEELQIPVPWGYISGKRWGPKSDTPLLAIHGWQDNSGTFDNLAPILAEYGHSVYCIDLPGHGLSSHFPEGQFYYVFWDGVHIVRRIMKHFGWKRISIMGHSLGGGIGFLYSAIYPEQVEKFISIDMASPSTKDPEHLISIAGNCVDKFMQYESLTSDMVPCYTYEEMIDIVVHGQGGSVTREGCEILMRRGMRPVEDFEGKYLFTRDPRLKVAVLGFFTQEQVLPFASKIKCEVLNIKAEPGMKMHNPEHYDEVLDVVEKGAKRVERHIVEGTHHLHLNDAESVADIIVHFLET